jgi:peptidoglycan glycosyltransferase
MARVAAAICNGGVIHAVHWTVADAAAGQPVIPPEHARMLSEYMRSVVKEGTGRSIAGSAVPIAGKTGTAELQSRPSHAWFIGYAPHSGPGSKKIAFAVIVENGRYGGRVAAPLAADIVGAAARLGIIDRE